LEPPGIRASFAAMASTSAPVGVAGPPPGEPPVPRVAVAFAAVYFIWGSTYLGIRWAIETMPPFGMASLRFLVAGTLMYGWSRASGAPAPKARQWRDSAISGSLLLAGGNGAVVVAEQWVPSGLAALLVATVPLWLVVLDTLFGSRVRPTARTVGGLLVGFGGVAVLAGSPGLGAGGATELLGGVIVLIGSLSWAAGSLYSRYTSDPPRPRMQVGTQMLCGSVVLGGLALVSGEARDFAWLALGYLITFGAIVGYGAYIWLLTVVEPARAGTYAYVNPVVAMLLGWALADEPMGFRSILAAAIILGSVVVITTDATWRPRSPARPASAVRGSP
jgi:drug/metabolite transporter (DMT)-like permease